MVNFFRDYDNAPERVKEFYRLNHAEQTLQTVLEKKKRFLTGKGWNDDGDKDSTITTCRRGVWDQLVRLNSLVDDSDPDTQLSQIQHAYQSAERARKDDRPDWFIASND